MNLRMAMRNVVFLFISLFLFIGCSSETEESSNKGHVWKTQTDSLDKAKAVEDILQDDFSEKSREIEDAY